MWIATAKKKTAKRWKNVSVSWESFVDSLREPLRTKETMREYKAMSKEERDVLKELPGGFVGAYLIDGMRTVNAVRERSMVTLDADYASPDDWTRVTCLYDDVAIVSYPTHSSTPDKPRLRWIVPTSRPMTPEEYPAVARKVAEWIGIDTMDTSTYDLNRLFYYPGVPADAPYELHVQDGKLLDPDVVLESYGPERAWHDATLWPIGSREDEVRIRSAQQAGDPTAKPGIVGVFCRTYDVPTAIELYLSDVYEPTLHRDRYTYIGGSTAAGAIVYNDGLFLYSNHATDPAAGHSVNAFDLVRIHKFGKLDEDGAEASGTPVTKLESYSAMCAWAQGLEDVRAQMLAERSEAAQEAFGDLTSVPSGDGASDDADGDQSSAPTRPDAGGNDKDWVRQLTLRPKSNEPEQTIANAQLIIEHDPRLKGRVAFNTFSLRRCAVDPLPWTPGDEGLRDWCDADDAGLRKYLEQVWHLNSRAAVTDAAELAARSCKRHPVREYLQSLKWDGVPRVETMLIDYLDADDTPLNREIAKRWMAAAVRRVYRPGCKFDTMLVLVSPRQGVGKSQFAGILAGEWFQDGLPQIGTKDAMQTLRGAWIIEVSEMAATKKTDDDAIKQFFSASDDRYRESYGRHSEQHKRQCVFVATTNTREFIFDTTGGRRFWTVDVRATAADVGARMDAMRGVRDQLWAEAYRLYKAGVPSWFSEPEYTAQLQSQQSQHTQEDEWLGWVESFLDRPLPDDWDTLSPDQRRSVMRGDDLCYTSEQRAAWTRRRETVTIAEIRNELLQEDLSHGAGGNNPSSRHLGRVLNVLDGWQLTGRQTSPTAAFGRQKIYVRAR